MLRNGQEVATPAYALTKLFGEKVTRAELLTRLHRMTRARREDRSFLYLNLETVLVDVDPEFSADGLAKFLLPHDCDLETLEAQLKPQRDQLEAARIAVLGPIESKLREAQRKLAGLSAESPEIPGLQAQISELAARYKSGCDRVLAEQASTLDAIKTRCLDFFDQNAISFAWLEKQFNRDTTKPLEDLVFLQSKNVVMVLDTTFPGQFTELAYAPRFELSLGAQPVSIINAATKETSAVPTSTPEVPTPPSEVLPPKPGEIEIQEPGGLPPKTGKQPEDGKTEESPGQESPGIESKPGDPKFEAPPKEQPEDEPEDESEEESKNRRRLKLGYFEALKRTFMAAGMQRQDGSAEASEAAIEQEQAGISNAFLKVLLRPGFIIVLSSMSSRRPLELADKEMSAFAYHLTRGAATEDRVQPFTTFNEKGQRTVQTRLIDVLNYVGSKVGRESRALGRPQEYGIFRKNKTDDFVLVQSTRER
jgi:hypothetical protein